MKNLIKGIQGIFLLTFSMTFNSCIDNKIIVYSDNRYTKIQPVETKQYKTPQLRVGQDGENALGLAISGGGSRAQYFGLGVLIGLDEIKENSKTFLNEIDYFSTVSGGGFGAGYYLTLKKNGVLNDFPSFFEYWKSKTRKDSLQEFLYKGAKASSTLKLWAYERNLVYHPYPTMIDNHLLQNGKKYKNQTIGKLYLDDFFIPLSSSSIVNLPMLVTNGTIYNNGERFPFMPHIIDSLQISGSLLPKESFKNGRIPLCYAIAGSAAFPGVLPMLKFSTKSDKNTVVRVIDGGAVDNLGFTTLFELLRSDKVANKHALVVDCGGFGNEIQTQENGKLGIGKLLKKSLLYTVDINLLYSNDNMKYIAKYYDFDINNIKRIGFSTIKDKFISLEKSINKTDASFIDFKDVKDKIISKDMDWYDVYKNFVKDFNSLGFDNRNISEIPSSQFSNFTIKQVFELFELSSQVETKIKIYQEEKQILVLAGRYSVFLEQNNLKNLLK
jgi:predicted acylesterase/phospholipase RssA